MAGEQQDGPEQVLVNDWCQQFQYHPGGGIEFGADGYLYVSGGDGARWEIFDYGQLGHPMNPCGDPPNPVGGPMSPPSAEGGRLRAQDLRTSGDPLGLNGSLIRIDPATGEGVPGNPMYASAEPNARRMLAHGFRNPVRLAIRPGTNDVWVADRGGGYWEEFDRVPAPTDPVRNFGWPCYEGGLDANGVPYARIRPRSDDQELDICEDLYDLGNATSAPYWGYDHELPVVPGEDCETDPGTGEPIGNQIGGVNFYPATGSFPAAYRNALFFADRLRNCMWAMLPGADGVPERGRVIPFGQQLPRAMDIEVAPNGDLLYVDQAAEAIQRIEWTGNSSNQAPVADAQADTVTGNRPLTVTFDASGSSDPDAGDLLIYEWDLDGDGEFGDSQEQAPTHTYLAGRRLHRHAARHGHLGRDGHGHGHHHGRKRAGRLDRHAHGGDHLGDRRRDRLLGHGDGRRGRHASRDGARLERGAGELRRARRLQGDPACSRCRRGRRILHSARTAPIRRTSTSASPSPTRTVRPRRRPGASIRARQT